MTGKIDLSHPFEVGATLNGMGILNFVQPYIISCRFTPASQSIGQKILTRFVLETGDPEPEDLTEAHVHRWWKKISANAAATSLRAYHSTVSNFLRWLHLPDHLMAGIRRPKEPRTSPRVLSPFEVDQMRHACRNLRDRAIVELAHGIGLRCQETADLQVPDIDWSNLILTIHSKGGNIDELPFPERVALAIDAYYGQYPPPERGFVIRNLYNNNRGLKTITITQRVAEISYRAGVKKGPLDGRGAHGLRRSFANDRLKAGVNLRDLQALMRHECLSSTEKYLARSDLEDLRRALEKREAS